MSQELLESHLRVLSARPTESRIMAAITDANSVGKRFTSVSEIRAAARIFAQKELFEGVTHDGCKDPSVCVVMKHLENFLASAPGAMFHIGTHMRDEVLRDVRQWRSTSSECNPCPCCSTVVRRGLDSYMDDQDQIRANVPIYSRISQD